jgi:HNH endonuclease
MIEEKKVSKFMNQLAVALDDLRTSGRGRGSHQPHSDVPRKDPDLLTERNIASFWSRVSKADVSECWFWTGYITPQGYGRMTIRKLSVPAHRVSYFLKHGSWPDHTDHLCRNRLCVNPAHLESVTNRENQSRRAWLPSDHLTAGAL